MLRESTNGGETTGKRLTTSNSFLTTRERTFMYTSTYAKSRPISVLAMPVKNPSASVLVNAVRKRPMLSTRPNTSSVKPFSWSNAVDQQRGSEIEQRKNEQGDMVKPKWVVEQLRSSLALPCDHQRTPPRVPAKQREDGFRHPPWPSKAQVYSPLSPSAPRSGSPRRTLLVFAWRPQNRIRSLSVHRTGRFWLLRVVDDQELIASCSWAVVHAIRLRRTDPQPAAFDACSPEDGVAPTRDGAAGGHDQGNVVMSARSG